jgi:hypothetical protein
MLSDPRTLIRRLVWTVVQFALVMLFLIGFAPHARAQCSQPNPLCLSDNYLVTGDYVVAGVGLRGLGDATGFATGTINMPDLISVPATGVPNGADIVAAFLYWETVEKSQSAFAGQKGFFNGYPITGIALGNPNAPTSWSSGGCSGSSRGTTTLRTYRADVRPYLPVDASGRIVNNGNGAYQVRLADSGSNGGGTPLTLGASLVLIYRVLSPAVPLNAIVLYDGAFAPSNQSAPMSQLMQGFYQASLTNPIVKLTHIVGDGQPNKSETVSLNSATLPSLYGTLPPFPGVYNQNTISLTGGGSWDNPTWNFPNPQNPNPGISGGSATTSVVSSGSGSGCVDWGTVIFSTTVQNSDGDGIIDVWKQPLNPGYVDVLTNQWVSLPGAIPGQKDLFVELDWLTDLDGSAGLPVHSHLPKQAAIDKVGDALKNQTPSVHVHFDLGPGIYQGDPYVISYPVSTPPNVATFPGAGGNAISESILVCQENPTLCQFPGEATVGWKGGFLVVRNTQPDPNSTPPVPLMGNFQPGRGLSYHYVLFGHALGTPRTSWIAAGVSPSLSGTGIATLNSIVVSNNVGTVTLTTPPHLLKPGDPACSDANCDRVTIGGALQAQNAPLNGTFKYLTSPSSICNVNGTCTTTFTIQFPIPSPPGVPLADGTYEYFNSQNPSASEPQLGLAFGGPTSASGYSDIGGGDTAVMFGLWPADDPSNCQVDPSQPLTAQNPTYCVNQVGTTTGQAGTLLHELGHTLTLTHGGTFYPTLTNPNGTIDTILLPGQQENNVPFFAPAYGLNCNPAFLSSMNYLFQIRGFPDGGIGYSGQTLPSVSETLLNENTGIGLDLFTDQAAAHFTRWYAPPNPLEAQVQQTATLHCDGTPITDGAQMVRVEGSTFSAPIDWNNNLIVPDATEPVAWQDVNFNGSSSASPDPQLPPSPFLPFNDMQGFNDWVNFDSRQIGARAASFAFSGGGGSLFAPGGGSLFAPGGGSLFAPGGGSLFAPGGGSLYAGGGGSLFAPGGGSLFAPGGGSLYAGGGGTEQDLETACSTADPPTGLMATLGSKSVVLNWMQPDVCQVQHYDIWRATGYFPTLADVIANRTKFTDIKTLSRGSGAPPTTYTDKTVKNNTTYTYFVTDTNVQGATSGPSTPATIVVKF